MKKYIVTVDLGKVGYAIEASSKEEAEKVAKRMASDFISSNKYFCFIQSQKVINIV
jgi:hypothetical protein